MLRCRREARERGVGSLASERVPAVYTLRRLYSVVERDRGQTQSSTIQPLASTYGTRCVSISFVRLLSVSLSQSLERVPTVSFLCRVLESETQRAGGYAS